MIWTGIAVVISMGSSVLAQVMPVRAFEDPTSGSVVMFPGPFAQPQDAGGSPPILPNGWHLPGRNFRAGDGWWVLACNRTCSLSKARLSVTPRAHPDYDGPLLPGQHLVWSPLPFGLDKPAAHSPNAVTKSAPTTASRPEIIAAFKPLRELAAMKLSAGPVKTYLHWGMAAYPKSNGAGTMETLISMESGSSAVLRPRLRLAQKPAPGAPETGNVPSDELLFELRIGERRQRLGSYAWSIEGPQALAGRDYLTWAGDLDGDGKLDLLMSFEGRGWNSVLFLSSLAKPGELVGEAGRFRYWAPNDPGC